MRRDAIARTNDTNKKTLLSVSFSFLFMILCAFILSGCMPSGEQDVNTELFKSKEEMQERVAALRDGMKKKQVFETLQISEERFERLNSTGIQMCLYGNAQVQGTPSELERFRNKIKKYEGYMLPYREIKESSSLGFGTMQVEKTGHDLRLVLIFNKGRLMQHGLEGTHQVNQQEEKYLWESLIKRGIGFAF